MMRSRDEHLAWCKNRALEYLDRGDLENAFASMGSDLNKHPELKPAAPLVLLGMKAVIDHDARELRRWIEGFR